MNSNGLFTSVLEAINPNELRRSHTGKGAEFLTSPPPTNQEILNAAISTYHDHMNVVDTHTTCGLNYVGLASSKPHIAVLNNHDWKSKNIAPVTPTAKLIHTSPHLAPAVQAAHDDGDVWSLVIGISESAQFIIGEEGGTGVAFGLQAGGKIMGESYLAGKIGLDIDVAINLNLGIWSAPPEKLAGGFFGIEANLDLDVGVSLGIFVTGDQLQYMGFSVGIGAGIGGGATVVGGYTWVY